MIFAQEPWERYARDAPPLWAEHYEEIVPQELRTTHLLQLDVPLYQKLDQEGRLVILTARDSSDTLQGYAVFTLYFHPHFATLRRAHEDHHFIRRAARGARVGLRLVQEAEALLRKLWVEEIVWHTKPWLDNGRLFEHCGYVKSDVLYTKQLGGGF